MTRELRTIGTFPISALRAFYTVSFCTVAFLYCGILHCGFLHCVFSAQCHQTLQSRAAFSMDAGSGWRQVVGTHLEEVISGAAAQHAVLDLVLVREVLDALNRILHALDGQECRQVRRKRAARETSRT